MYVKFPMGNKPFAATLQQYFRVLKKKKPLRFFVLAIFVSLIYARKKLPPPGGDCPIEQFPKYNPV